jgi:hypothetical protein
VPVVGIVGRRGNVATHLVVFPPGIVLA